MLLAEPPEFNPPKLVGDHFGKKLVKSPNNNARSTQVCHFGDFMVKASDEMTGISSKSWRVTKKKTLADLVN